LNYDFKNVGEKMMIQVHELEELRLQA